MLPNKQFHKIICILVNVYVYIGIYIAVVCLCMTGFARESRSAFHLYLLILLAKQGWRATHWEVQSAKLMPSTLRQCMCMCVCVCTRTKRLLDLAASYIPHLNCFNCSQSTNAGTQQRSVQSKFIQFLTCTESNRIYVWACSESRVIC